MFGWLRSSGNTARPRERLRVLLAIPSYRGGGAERVVTTLARRLSRDRFEVHLVVVQDDGPLGQELPVDVVQHDLNCRRVSQAALPLLRLVRQLRPDVVMTAASHLNVLAGMLRPAFPGSTKLVIRETGVLETSLATWHGGRIMKPLLAASYRQAERVIGQSSFALEEIHAVFGVPRQRLTRIANPVEGELLTPELRSHTDSPFSPGGPHLLCVGRLGPEKGFDRAIAALPALKQTHPNAQLWIIGEGTERAALEQQARQLGVAESVHLPGFQSDVPRWMAHADLFVLSSRSESLPNVLLEAVACGCPVVALEQIGGTREVLDQLGLTNRWVTSLSPWREEWFSRPGPEVREQLIEQFHWQSIVAEYERMLEEVVRDAEVVSVQSSVLSQKRAAA